MAEEQGEQAILTELGARRPRYERLRDEAGWALGRALEVAGIQLHGEVSARVKTDGSFLRKVRRKECVQPFEEITDIVGLRAVCLFTSQLPQIRDIIQREFSVIRAEDRGAERDESSFGYRSVHFLAKLSPRYQGPRYDGLHDLVFEIQTRTIVMHAWASVSHYLDYKSPLDIPTDLRRDFHALSAMFYVVDKHFELFFAGSQRSKEEARTQAEQIVQHGPSGQDPEVNLDSLSAYLRARFPERDTGPSASVSRLVDELIRNGYRRLSQIDGMLDRGADDFAAGEREHPPEGTGGRYTAVGVVRVSLAIVDPDYGPSQSRRPT
jgi:putative GTP pyrophosphokinase